MDYRHDLQKVVDYIEQNLCGQIDVEACARTAGYSKYHFIRIFRYFFGCTPADYIRKRRLSEIADQMDHYEGSIADLAFQYGFNSKENFIRAFKSEHHILPTEYRKAKNCLRLYPKVEMNFDMSLPDPVIQKRESLFLTVYKSNENVPHRFWNQYNCQKLSEKLSGGAVVMDYGVSDWNAKEEKLFYYIGVETEQARGDIRGTMKLIIPGGTYAVFTTPKASHFDFVNTIQNTWRYINEVWRPLNSTQCVPGYEFECYVEQSRTYTEKIFIPVREELP